MKEDFRAGLIMVGAGGHGRVAADIAITGGIPARCSQIIGFAPNQVFGASNPYSTNAQHA